MKLGGAFLAGLAFGLATNERVNVYEQGRYDGQFVGRGDGGYDILDGRNRFAGRVAPSRGSSGFDVYDARGLFQRTIKR